MRFQLDPQERPDTVLRRIGGALIDDAIAQVDDPNVPTDEAVHEARKDIKKLRGLLRLVRPAAPDLYKAENRPLRDAAAHLALVRDADAALETFDLVLRRAQPESAEGAKFAAACGKQAGQPSLHDDVEPLELGSLRARLVAYQEEVHAGAGDMPQRLAQFRTGMREARARVDNWQLPCPDEPAHDFDLLGPGLAKTYKRGRKAMQRAYKEPSVEAFHDWRKRTKYLGYHLRLLQPAWPKLLKAQRQAVKDLQSLLGDDHDLAVLAELLRTLRKNGQQASASSEAELALNSEMRRQSELLRRRARGLGKIIYVERPKALRRRLGAYWRQGQHAA
jgi:CHAD domain-containing protein